MFNSAQWGSNMSTSILRFPQVKERVGLGRTSIYALINKGEFPRPVQISSRCVGWPEADIEAWLQQKINQHRAA